MMPMMGKAAPVEAETEAAPGMEAVIEALEQARAALDQVEAAATQGRRDKLKAPAAVPVETAGATDEQE